VWATSKFQLTVESWKGTEEKQTPNAQRPTPNIQLRHYDGVIDAS